MDAYSETIEQLKNEILLLKAMDAKLLSEQNNLGGYIGVWEDMEKLMKERYAPGTKYEMKKDSPYARWKGRYSSKYSVIEGLSILKSEKKKLENKKSVYTGTILVAVVVFLSTSIWIMTGIPNELLAVKSGLIFFFGALCSGFYLGMTRDIRILGKTTVEEIDEEIAYHEETMKMVDQIEKRRGELVIEIFLRREAINSEIKEKNGILRICIQEKGRLTDELMASQIDQAIQNGDVPAPEEFVKSKKLSLTN